MSQRHPLASLSLYWLLFVLILVGGWCLIPTPNPTHEPRARVTVLPTLTLMPLADVFTVPASPTVTPIEAVLLPTRTPGPSATRTPWPTGTPVPPTPSQRPVQKG